MSGRTMSESIECSPSALFPTLASLPIILGLVEHQMRTNEGASAIKIAQGIKSASVAHLIGGNGSVAQRRDEVVPVN